LFAILDEGMLGGNVCVGLFTTSILSISHWRNIIKPHSMHVWYMGQICLFHGHATWEHTSHIMVMELHLCGIRHYHNKILPYFIAIILLHMAG
jgi:hypothetical protein